MKTLDQLHDRIGLAEERLERRIPLSSFPVTIVRSGSYYLIGSATFSAPTGNAITITVSDVTIDLMGFTLKATAGVTGDAIHINSGLRNVAVFNGAISGTTTVSTSGFSPNRSWSSAPGGFRYGVETELGGASTTNCHFSQLRISGCRQGGLRTRGGSVIDRVAVAHNGGKGIEADSGAVTNSTATFNFGQGILAASGTITDSTADNNGEEGFSGHAISNSSSTNNGENGFAGNVVTNCSASSNQLAGITVTDGTVTNCTAKANAGAGIRALNGVVAFCRARGNDGPNIEATGGVVTGSNGNN